MSSTNDKLNEILEGEMRASIDASDLVNSVSHREKMRRRMLYGGGDKMPVIRKAHSDSVLSPGAGGPADSRAGGRSRLRETLGDNGTVISYSSRACDDGGSKASQKSPPLFVMFL